ncbi:hypothetical protein JR316_0012354 [Psilocybe cubensis]|uniref:Uncharacterized protein n=1 Tax=Psilocybe cubensis TaxID=181762 RepID=A0ACB8GI66_PSICU|nr:hypothetical protein JR316_0012354 [Psilocybe cubensis]KAH9475243.1 hypothetical protein JR316_0012354 [Psilocybe cubensis]
MTQENTVDTDKKIALSSKDSSTSLVSKAFALRPVATQYAEIALLRQHLKILQQQRDEAIQEANILKDVQRSYLRSVEAARGESILKSQENELLIEKLRKMTSALQQTHEELDAHISYRTSAQEMIKNISKDNAKLKHEVTDLKAQLHVLSTQNSKGDQLPSVKTVLQDTSKAIFRFETQVQGNNIAHKTNFPLFGKSSTTSSCNDTTPSPSASNIKEEPASVYLQSRQVARLPATRLDRVRKLVNTETSKPIVPQQDGAASPPAPAAADVTSSTAINPAPTLSRAPMKKKPTLKTGNDILWRGYGCPKNTPVPECTSADGYHIFNGKGTNRYATKYNCAETFLVLCCRMERDTGTTVPAVTGNDIPDEVWRIIAQLVSSSTSSMTRYMAINRTFFNYALSQRYREVQWVVLDQALVKQLDRLQSPLIAQHVRTLHIRAWFIEYLLRRAVLYNPSSSFRKAKTALKKFLLPISSKFGAVHFLHIRPSRPPWILQHEQERAKDGMLSFEVVIRSMIQAIAGMTNVVEFNFEWRDLPVNRDTLMFLILTRTAFDRSLRKLNLRAPIAKFKELLPNANFDNIEDLTLHFDYRTSDQPSKTLADLDAQQLLDTVVPFIAQRRSSLQSLTISSSALTDLSSFFSAFPTDFISLREFSFDISFHSDLLSDLNGIIKFLESCRFSLRHVSLAANWEHQHVGLLSYAQAFDDTNGNLVDNGSHSGDVDTRNHNPWIRMNNLLLVHSTCLSNLHNLAIPFISLSNTLPLVRRSCDTLTHLCLTGRFLTLDEVEGVAGLFSHRSLEITRLQIMVGCFDRRVLATLAKGMPDLGALVMAFENMGDLTYETREAALDEWRLSFIKTSIQRDY